jgi:hypothetical protein
MLFGSIDEPMRRGEEREMGAEPFISVKLPFFEFVGLGEGAIWAVTWLATLVIVGGLVFLTWRARVFRHVLRFLFRRLAVRSLVPPQPLERPTISTMAAPANVSQPEILPP